jgi:hypothetical protein
MTATIKIEKLSPIQGVIAGNPTTYRRFNPMSVPKALSELLFAIFMIVFGLTYFISIPYSAPILGILALAVGILKFLGR